MYNKNRFIWSKFYLTYQVLAACLYPVILILYHTTVWPKYQTIHVEFSFFLFSKLFFQQCFPGPSYPEMNTFLFCSVGTSMAFVMDNGDWADIGEKYLFFVGMPLFVSKCIIVYMSNLIFLPFTSYLQSPLNFLSIPSILTWKVPWQVKLVLYPWYCMS